MNRQLLATPTSDTGSSSEFTRTRLGVTDRTHAAQSLLCDTAGPHVVVLAWPSRATALPEHLFTPGPFHVIISHIERCPVYADLRQLVLFPRDRLVLDADQPRLLRRRPRITLRALDTPADTSRGLRGQAVRRT